MAWVDFKKVYAIVLYVWIIKTLLIGHLSPNAIALLKSTMVDLKTKSISGDNNLGEVNINQGIFQGDSSSPLLFIMSMIPLTIALRRMKQGYSFQKGKSKLNYL